MNEGNGNDFNNESGNRLNNDDNNHDESVDNKPNHRINHTDTEARKILYTSNKKTGGFRILVVTLIAALLGGLIGAYIAPTYLYGKYIPFPYLNQGENITINPNDDLSNVTAVSKKSMSCVVGITTIELKNNWFSGIQEVQGVGSGIIVNSNGYILTNSHVIGDGKAADIKVQYKDGTKENAEIIWFEQALDLAIIKTKSTNLPVAELGDSDVLEVGELAVAIGNPLGLQFQRTVTSGIISGLDRSIRSETMIIDNLIQTDASINPGNSGGPLLNSKGQVIGINTAKITSAEGLGFSVPINTAKPIIEQVIKTGKFDLAYIGIGGYEVSIYERATGQSTGVDFGVVILQVTQGSPAMQAGIQAGDILIKVDDKEIADMTALRRYLYNFRPLDTVRVTYIRNGSQNEVDVVLGNAP